MDFLVTRFAEACTTGTGGSFLGFPTWYKYLQREDVGGKCGIKFQFPTSGGNMGDLTKVLLAIVEIMLRVGALVAVAFVIYGGFRYILSQGEPEKAAAGRRTIINALVGLVIASIATVIVSFIARTLT